MKEDNQTGFRNRVKNIFTLKRTRLTLYMAAVLWVAFGTQVFINHIFKENLQITEAFIKTETKDMQTTLEVVAQCDQARLSDSEINEIIHTIADSIGLKVDSNITVWDESGKSEHFYFKQAKQASTKIEVVSINEKGKDATVKNYIIVKLNILKGIESIDKYKNTLMKTLSGLGVKNEQVTLKYEGSRDGILTADQKHELAVLLIDDLQGKIALEYDEGDLYTVYGYTGMLNEYVTSLGNKINVQIAITYNEITNKTKIELATPMLNDSY